MSKNITALMPVKNGTSYIQTSLTQIQLACKATDEIIVIDDFSDDNTAQIVKNASKQDARIRLIKNSIPGIVGALNLGLSEASNDWIARFDVDDKYEPNRIEEQRASISSNIIGVFSDYDFFSEDVPYLGIIPSAINSDAVAISLISSQRTPHPSILFNKASVLDVGGYQQKDFPAEDLSLWLRMSRVGKLISIPKVLLHYRISSGSVTGTKRRAANSMKRKLLENIGINSRSIQKVLDDFERIIENYGEENYSNEREILLIRDLLMIQKNNNTEARIKKKIRNHIFVYALKNATSNSKIKTILKLQSEKKLRDTEKNLA
jgi:glycosyltransferase involved in cell wall biosynthesis